MDSKIYPPIHPGEILLEEFLLPMGVSQYRLAKSIGVPPRCINEIVHGTRRITPEVGIKLSRVFGLNDRFWSGLQMDYDLEVIREANHEELADLVPIAVSA